MNTIDVIGILVAFGLIGAGIHCIRTGLVKTGGWLIASGIIAALVSA